MPNIPAIPGMCPGIVIKAGGAGGGGSGAGRGKGKGRKKGARTKGGKDDAKDGKKNAGACGNGSNADGGCPNPQHGGGGQVTAGDPVDVATGRVFTVPAVDLALGGPLPFILRRSYSTTAIERDVGLGFGWCHSFAWEIQVRRRQLLVWTSAGGKGEFDLIAMGESVHWDIGLLRRQPWGFLLCSSEGLFRAFVELAGTGRFLLSEVSDRNGNRITLQYDRGVLVSLTDCVGRVIIVRRDVAGRIYGFEAPLDPAASQHHSLRTYRYSAEGDLIAAVNADGAETRFGYEEHHLVRLERPSGLVVHYRYDREQRCVESWADYGTAADPSLDAEVPELLADGATQARGVHHIRLDFAEDGYVEVADSRQVKRVFTNENDTADKLDWGGAIHSNHFDEHGELSSYTDGEHQTWRWLRDDDGRLISVETPSASRLDFTYHASGEPELISGPDTDFVQYLRDLVGNPLQITDHAGVVVSYKYNDRGQWVSATLPNGGVTRCEYDAWGNRVTVTEPDGVTKSIRYDHWGRPLALREASGLETTYHYDLCGRLEATRNNAGIERRTVFDAQGRVSRMIGPDGRPLTLHYGGLDRVVRVERPDGTGVDYRYDREGGLVRIVNENGEEHRLFRTSAGYIGREVTFDGRTVDYTYDANGEVRSKVDGETKVDVVTAPSGAVKSREYADGTFEEFEYDARDRLLRARNAHSEVVYTYDGRGNVTSEHVTVGQRSYAVSSEYNLAAERVRSALAEGALGDGSFTELELGRTHYDLVGRTTRLELPEASVTKTYDAAGNEVARRYHAGGTLRRQVGLLGEQTQWEVFSSGAGEHAASERGGGGAPHWYRAYVYDATGDVVEVAEPDGRTRFEHDGLGRLWQRTSKAEVGERYRHDVTGNWYPDGHRQYDRGGRLVRHDDVQLIYNLAGYVIERRRTLADGAHESTHFTWNGAGQLATLSEPDGRHHTFVHDVFGRCLLQETTRERVIESRTVFTWDGEQLIREQTSRYTAGVLDSEEERNYAYEPGTVALLAERRRWWTPTAATTNGDGEAADGSLTAGGHRTLTRDTGWLFHESAHDGSASVLLFPDGRVAEHADIDPWGRLGQNHRSGTHWRRQGQYQAPAGLYYNRHRFYDPEAGVYLSPEPLGIGESLKPYAYVDNYPHRVVDVDGLKPRMRSTVTRKNGLEPIGGVSGDSVEGKPKDLHPAVVAALPPNNARDGGNESNVKPSTCSEPHALSNHIRDWEGRNRTPPPPKSCAPGDDNWREHLKSAMDEVDEISSKHDKTGPAAACPNCSQTIPRLAKLAGSTPPKIGTGKDYSVKGKEREGSHSTSLPTDEFIKNKAENDKPNTKGLTPSQAKAVENIDLALD